MDVSMDNHTINAELLERFEKGINLMNPHESSIPARIIGYGEISTIFEILEPSLQGLAFKRLPIFRTEEEISSYEHLFHEYNRIIREDIGISVPWYTSVKIDPGYGNRVIYCIQEKLTEGSICHQLLGRLDLDSNILLLRAILREMKKVHDFNASQDKAELALDAQISNWALQCESLPDKLTEGNIPLVYIDTSTPLMRMGGREQLDTELFLRSAPSFLVWLIKLLFLEDVVTRYYDPHLAVVDLVANLYKEQRDDLVEPFIAESNRFLEREVSRMKIEPITLKEVRAYYREDAFIWRLYLGLRRFDRFLHRSILKKPYIYILPGKIKR
jgi:hypothetical protein